MSVRSPALAARLDALRADGDPRVAPLWIEGLPPEAALAAARGVDQPLARLQEVRFLSLLGRKDEAEKAAAGVRERFPPGFGPLFAVSGTDVDGARVEPEEGRFPPGAGELATRTMGELYLAQGERERAVAIFRAVLDRDPGDDATRRRLGALTGRSRPDVDGAEPLTVWLEAVQDWRKTLGV